AAASVATDLGIGFLIPPLINPPAAVGFLTSEVLSLLTSNSAYRQAIDPPDPDYKRLATLGLLTMPELDALPSSLFKDYALAMQRLDSVEVAEATSRDRALGAEAAGDEAWQATQLAAASGFASDAAAIQSHLADLQEALSPFIARSFASRGSDV